MEPTKHAPDCRMEVADSIPVITITGVTVSSNANVPKTQADLCASWTSAGIRQARKLLKSGATVYCLDATAHVAMCSIALDMLIHGREVKTTTEQIVCVPMARSACSETTRRER